MRGYECAGQCCGRIAACAVAQRALLQWYWGPSSNRLLMSSDRRVDDGRDVNQVQTATAARFAELVGVVIDIISTS